MHFSFLAHGLRFDINGWFIPIYLCAKLLHYYLLYFIISFLIMRSFEATMTLIYVLFCTIIKKKIDCTQKPQGNWIRQIQIIQSSLTWTRAEKRRAVNKCGRRKRAQPAGFSLFLLVFHYCLLLNKENHDPHGRDTKSWLTKSSHGKSDSIKKSSRN